MKKFLKWMFIILFSLLFIGLLTGVVFIYNLDLNTYKPQIEQMVLKQTGRKLSLMGDIGFKMSLKPTLNIKKASLADANWAGDTPMIMAEEVDVSVAIIPLFSKVICVENIKLIQPKIHLSLNEKGEGNWLFEKQISKIPENIPETQKGFLSDMKLMIKQLSVEDGIITYDSSKTKMNLQIKYLSLKPDKNQIFVDYNLLYNDQKVKGTMKGDALEHLIKGKSYHAEIDTSALNCQIKASVDATDIFKNWNVKGEIDVISSEGNFHLPAFHLNSDIDASSEKISLKTQQLNFGKSILQAEADISLKEKMDIQAKINASLLDIPSLTFSQEKALATKNSQNTKASFPPKGELNLNFLNQFNAHIVFDIQQLNLTKDFTLNQMTGITDIQNGILTVKPFSCKIENGNLKANLTLNSKENNLNIKVDGSEITLDKLIKAFVKNFPFQNANMADFSGTLSTRGSTYQKLFENLNASIQMKKLSFDKSQLNADLNISFKNRWDVVGKVTSPLLDVSFLIPSAPTKKSPTTSVASKNDFLPEGELDLAFFNHFNADVSLDITRIIFTPEADLNKLKGKVEIKDGIFNLKKLSFIMAEGSVDGDLLLNSKENDVKLNLDGKKIVLSKLMKIFKINTNDLVFKEGGIFHIYGALKTKGKSYRHLLKNLQGQALLAIGPSQIKSNFLKYIQGNFLTQLASSLNISPKENDINLRCAVVRADFDQGKAQFPKGIAFDSKELKLVADGNINLADYNIDMLIQPLNGDLINTNAGQILSSLIKITGTLMKPSIAVNSASVIKNAVGIVAGGPIFVGAQLLLDSDADPCYTALQGTSYSNMFTQTTGVKAGMQRTYRQASGAMEGAVSGVINTTYEGSEKITNYFFDWF